MDNAEQFLKAEEAANRLTDSLKKLKDEMEVYRSAADSLNTAVDGLTGLAEQVTAVAKGVQDGLESICSAGGPEILNRVDALGKETRQSFDGIAKHLDLLPGVAGAVAAVEQTLHDSEASLTGRIDSLPGRTVEAMQPSVDSVVRDVAAVEQTLHDSEASLTGRIDSLPGRTVEAMQPSVDSVVHDVRTIRLLAILGLLASLAALVLSALPLVTAGAIR